jgi:hypothetical protein
VPLYYFTCATDGEVRKILKPAEAAQPQTCEDCGGNLVRKPRGPTANKVERLDAPHMARAVERPADAERLYRERAQADTRKNQ